MGDEDERPPSRSWSTDLGMELARDGETLRRAVEDAVQQLGPVAPGWTRYVRVQVIDLPPSAEGDAE
jgi:hypothetical protein